MNRNGWTKVSPGFYRLVDLAAVWTIRKEGVWHYVYRGNKSFSGQFREADKMLWGRNDRAQRRRRLCSMPRCVDLDASCEGAITYEVLGVDADCEDYYRWICAFHLAEYIAEREELFRSARESP